MRHAVWGAAAVGLLAACGRNEKPAPSDEVGRSSVTTEPSRPPPPATPGPASQPASPTSPPTAPAPTRWSFDDIPSGKLPPGWVAATGHWEVTEGKALRQMAQSPARVFNLVLGDTRAKNLIVRVRLRAVSGKTDQGGGLVWRATDPRNYYIARYNPLEKNFRVYTVKDGERKQLASADVELAGDEWHLLVVRMAGDHFEGSIDGKKYLDVRDATFADSGTVGLWTKADAVTDFDDLELATPAPATPEQR